MGDRESVVGISATTAFLAVADAADEAILTQNLDGTVVSWNAAAEELYGYAADQIVGKPIDSLIPSDRRAELEGILAAIAAGEKVTRFETIRVTKAGKRIRVSTSVSPIADAGGRVVGAVAVARGLDAGLLFSAEGQRSERLDVASRVARGIAHELVDLVTAIQGHASLILEDLADDPRTRASVETVRRATAQAAEIARQLLALSGEQLLLPRALDLNKTILSSMRLLGGVAGRSTVIELDLDPLIPEVLVDPDQLDHVLVGLIAASRDRLPPGGRISLATRPGTAASGDPDVVLTVRDNGSAIPAEELDAIFEPFPGRTRSGDWNLWLATARGILTQSGGSIRAETAPDGTVFTVRLPAVMVPARSTLAPVIEPLPRGSEWILVVEDEDGVREFIERALERLGYQVMAVASGEEALERVRGYFAEPINLLIADVVLPGMSGPELASTLSVSRPEMPVLYVSGYASDVTAFHGLPGLADHVLAKPFGMDVLAHRVRTILDAQGHQARPAVPESKVGAEPGPSDPS